MKKYRDISILILILFFVVYNFTFAERRIRVGPCVGFGLPKIPISHFRNPISLVGGAAFNCRITNRLVLQLDGEGLTTFSLGTIDQSEGKLRYNQVWSSFDLLYRIKGSIRNESFILIGSGFYHLSQQFDNKEDDINTSGVNLGLVTWMHRGRITRFVDFRWHLLFEPNPNPQVLAVTFGIML